MGLDSQNNNHYNIGLRPDEFERSRNEYEHMGEPVNVYVPTFEIANSESENDWMIRAACKGVTGLFFPPSAERPQAKKRREALAKKICESCSVEKQCLNYALEAVEFGYWAGTDEYDRGRISGQYPKGSAVRASKKAI